MTACFSRVSSDTSDAVKQGQSGSWIVTTHADIKQTLPSAECHERTVTTLGPHGEGGRNFVSLGAQGGQLLLPTGNICLELFCAIHNLPPLHPSFAPGMLQSSLHCALLIVRHVALLSPLSGILPPFSVCERKSSLIFKALVLEFQFCLCFRNTFLPAPFLQTLLLLWMLPQACTVSLLTLYCND
ncbi:6-pyruvoyl tetrahydrobiopterin synthase isoform X2 [Homo sapiens]|uniref:6-pyruvoyl tetrahydrobiopterin synthase isoform X2 n=1 Tax=Homo sapiens TaxID=9606 RepID=UPI0023DEF7E3|nr:6-pyruvoyl tetrahydrobiopterin synthase isoform X2 [Homo sapiens]